MPNSFDEMLVNSRSLTSVASAPNMAILNSSSSIELPAVKRTKREDIVTLLMEEEGHSLDAAPSFTAKRPSINAKQNGKFF